MWAGHQRNGSIQNDPYWAETTETHFTDHCRISIFFIVCMCVGVCTMGSQLRGTFEIESKAPITGFGSETKIQTNKKNNVLESVVVNKDMAKITVSQTTLFC